MRLIIVLCFLFLSCSFNKENCQSLKEGTFKVITQIENSPPITTVIVRKGNIQIERSEEIGVELKFKVEWLNDCQYKLIWLETIKDVNNFGYPKNQILTNEIIEIASKSHVIEATSNLYPDKIKIKLERISEKNNGSTTTPKKH